MSTQYPGGFVTKSPILPNGTTAQGIWTLSEQAAYNKQNLWPSFPYAPTIGTASNLSTDGQVSVAFTAPAITSSTITQYTVTSSPGGITATGASSPITVSGLTNGVSYTFTVFATSAVGNGPSSASSNSVIPTLVQQVVYNVPGTYSWVAPAGLNPSTVSVLCVGGGGGAGGFYGAGTAGGNSSFHTIVTANGGGNPTGGTGTTISGSIGGGNGGNGSSGNMNPVGGGAGGYSGKGGNAGSATVYGGGSGGGVGLLGEGANGTGGSPDGQAGSGGGGGGGAGYNSSYNNQVQGGAGSGGSGTLYGGGYGGGTGGGNGGGGGGLRYYNNYAVTAGNSYTVIVGAGGVSGPYGAATGGAVRIMYSTNGVTRAYPSTNTNNL